MKLVDFFDRVAHGVLEDAESERLGVRIWELFAILCWVTCPPQVKISLTIERNKAKAHSESNEVAFENVRTISPQWH